LQIYGVKISEEILTPYICKFNAKIVICINKSPKDSLPINDLLENIKILIRYIISQKRRKFKMKSSIKINEKDLPEYGFFSPCNNFRSLEKLLEKHNRKFNCDDFEKIIEIEVSDKIDALRLSKLIGLSKVNYSVDNVTEELTVSSPKKLGRPKCSVFIETTGEKMTVKQFRKYSLEKLQKTHLTKTQILKRKILTKTQLEKYINDGTLKRLNCHNRSFISMEELFSLLRSLSKERKR